MIRALSRGGMGAIYLAKDHNAFERQVVVKAMLDYFDPTKPEETQAAFERFKHEARTLAQLSHPAIPKIFTYFQEDGRNFIVMEYIEGENFEQGLSRVKRQQVFRGKPFPIRDVITWGQGLCQILEYLASLNPPVVHHDIKPANVIRDTYTGAVRLVDFGTARARLIAQPGGSAGLQRSSVYGTQGYSPPEQYRGESDPRSDVYAVAATLYHLATDDDPSDHPFDFPKIGELGPLGEALLPALAFDVNKRPDATELRIALENLPELHPIVAPDQTLLYAEVGLARWLQANQLTANQWIKTGLLGSIESVWKKASLAGRLRSILDSHASDYEIAYDLLLRELDPLLPPPVFLLTPNVVDFGTLDARASRVRQVELYNTGQHFCALEIRGIEWLKVLQPTVLLKPGERKTITLQATGLGKPSEKLQGVVEIRAHTGMPVELPVKVSITVPPPGITAPDGTMCYAPVDVAHWCEANWSAAESWLFKDMAKQLQKRWPYRQDFLTAISQARQRFARDWARALDVVLVSLDSDGYGKNRPSMKVEYKVTDEAATGGVAVISNCSRRCIFLTLKTPEWMKLSCSRLDVPPRQQIELPFSVNWPVERTRMKGTVRALHDEQTLSEIPVEVERNIKPKIYTIKRRSIGTHDGIVRVVSVNPTGTAIASGGADGTVRLWNGQTFKQLQLMQAHKGAVYDIAWIPNGNSLVTIGQDRSIRVWESVSGRPRLEWASSRSALCVACTFDGKMLVTGLNGGHVEVWDARKSNTLLHRLKGHHDDLQQVVASPTSLLVASTAKDGLVNIWDVSRGKLLRQLGSHSGAAGGLAWSPDGKQLATGGEDRLIKIWDATAGKVVRTFKGHTAGITTISWSSDGQWIASAGWDKSIYLWNVTSGKSLKTPAAYSGCIWSVDFHPDSTRFFSGGVEKTNSVQQWRIVTSS